MSVHRRHKTRLTVCRTAGRLALATALAALSLTATALDYARVGAPVATVFPPGQHGGHNQNWSWYQTTDGLIYVAHTTGVSQWDGETWQNLATPGSTPVRAVCQWSGDGRLYAGTTNDLGAFGLDDTNALTFQSLIADWSFDARQFGEVWSIACVTGGVVFVTSQSVFLWDGATVTAIDAMPTGRYRLFVIDDVIVFKPNPERAVRTLRIDAAPSVTTTPLTLPAPARVRRILRSRRGEWVAVTMQHGVFVRRDGVFEQRVTPTDLLNVALYNATQARDGTYYLAGLYDGLLILDEDFRVLRHYREEDGLSMDGLFSVNEDQQGSLWITGTPNVAHFAPPHTVSRFKAGNTSTEIMSLEPSDAGLIAVGNALHRLSASPEPLRMPRFERFTESQDIYVDAFVDGERLIYSGLQGIFTLPLDNLNAEPTRLIEVGLGREIRRHPINGALYVISDQGLYRLSETPDGVPVRLPGTDDVLDAMEITDDGVIWMGTATQKLYRVIDPYPAVGAPDVRRLEPADGVPEGAVAPFRWQGRMVFGTSRGLRAYDPAASPPLVPVVDALADLSDEPVAPVLFYDDEQAGATRLWFQSGGTSLVLDRAADGTVQTTHHVFARFDGSRPSTVFSASPTETWHIQNKGVITRLDARAALTPPPVATLNIRGVTDQRSGNTISADGTALALTHETNSIRIHYALTDSASGRPIEYRYRLLGSDNERWSTWSTASSADYTTLSGGRYEFNVQARDAWRRVIDAGFSFPVAPPWYQSRAALMLYALAGLLLLVLTSWLTQRWRTAKLTRANEELERVVAERTRDVERQAAQLREQQTLKDRFFGNVSHEFRTPLTLTIGPLETLVSEHEKQLSAPVVQLANTALNNARRMLALVGQVLDLNRLEAGKLPLRVGRYDLAALVLRIEERFRPWADEHGHTLVSSGCDEPVERWFDEDQIDRCVSNLVSNAIKYSGDGSRIELSLILRDDQTGVEVCDNGVGIAKVAQAKVFERFVQGEASEQVTTPGTGIGLALVKEVIELHGGRVTLESDAGQGSRFTLWLRDGDDHFRDEQRVEPIYAVPRVADAEQEHTEPAKHSDDQTTLLIVDDNRELLNFISLRLSATYRILQASNGQAGFDTACRELPDLIISDVMMPVMTGLEMVRKLKDTPATHTIPVILLTAKATKRETVEGFAHGADDYLTKPFDTSELIVRVNAQITARKAIRDTLMREARAQSQIGANESARPDFEARFNAAIDAHIGDTDLNVRALARHLHMSTDTLTRRCKKALGKTPLEALTQARLDRATSLLKAGELTVSEVGYSVGFESLAYFSRRYKKFTGVNPSDVLRRG